MELGRQETRAVYPKVDRSVATFEGKAYADLHSYVRIKDIDGVYRLVLVYHRLRDIIGDYDMSEALVDFTNKFHHECYNVQHMYEITGEEDIDQDQTPERARLMKMMGIK